MTLSQTLAEHGSRQAIAARLDTLIEQAISRATVLDECAITTAVDWQPGSPRSFQVVSVHCGQWGHTNWYGPPLSAEHVTACVNTTLARSLPRPIVLAALDGLARAATTDTGERLTLVSGDLHLKTRHRTECVLEELAALAVKRRDRPLTACAVAFAGYFRDFVERYRAQFGQIRWMDSSIAGGGCLRPFECDDIVVASGSALVDGSLPDLLRLAGDVGASTLVLAETCPYLMPTLLDGECDVLVCERFPFFFMDGPTELASWRWYER